MDLIDRQGAIDALWTVRYQLQTLDDTQIADKIMHGLFLAENTLKCLPSAQPEYTEQDMRDEFSAGYDCGMEAAQHKIVRCKDCAKHEYCRTSTVWAVAPDDDWFCADAERRTE